MDVTFSPLFPLFFALFPILLYAFMLILWTWLFCLCSDYLIAQTLSYLLSCD